jgi:hypothetical protein
MFWAAAVVFLASSAAAEEGPNRIDFMFAQADHMKEIIGDGLVHCNRFKRYKAKPTADPNVYEISYLEYREHGPWKKLKATLRREGDEWLWLAGDPPKCSITVFAD